jgi:3'(2'), 5'-bisphosphate nucleotidase
MGNHEVNPLKDSLAPGISDELLDLCACAGDAICREYAAEGAGEFEKKADDTPLTRADLASHRILEDGLQRLAPAVPVLSEESRPEAVRDRRQWSRLWLVDPLDGTREFLNRTGEFTINLALVEAGRPVLGVLYLPLERTAYAGIPGRGAWRCRPAEAGGWERTAIASKRSGGEPCTVLASRRHRNERLEQVVAFLEAREGPVQRCNSGSALKFAQLAAGEGDVYPRFSPCSEWDVAAGQALVEAAGGAVLGLDGEPLRYNARDTLLSPPFLAVADPRRPLWRELLAQL